jgi:hypothetical protein
MHLLRCGGNRPLLHFGSPVGEGTAVIHLQGQESQTCSGGGHPYAVAMDDEVKAWW